MIKVNIPGKGDYHLEHLVLDVNGTLAVDGYLCDGIGDALARLQRQLIIHLVTADTLGRQDTIDQQLGLQAIRIQGGNEAEQKAAYVNELGAEKTIAIGQGENDREMLHQAALGICILSSEGTATQALLAADLVVPNIQSAFDLLEKPKRITASLRR